jgi:tRNA U34 5-methylaminomethyl-2-thiouridine-forming methyltransferase MnmC
VFLIVDGHPAHRSKLVKAYIESLAGKLRLFFLPPYSPELNPDELVWNDVKNNAVGRSRHDGQKICVAPSSAGFVSCRSVPTASAASSRPQRLATPLEK